MHRDQQAAQAHQQALEGAALRHFRPTQHQLPASRTYLVETLITAALAGFCAYYLAAYLVGA